MVYLFIREGEFINKGIFSGGYASQMGGIICTCLKDNVIEEKEGGGNELC